MQIKKFTADNFAGAMLLVKKEFGEEALVMETRTLGGQKKIRGYGGMPPQVEITAAIERSAAGKAVAVKRPSTHAPIADAASEILDGDNDELKALIWTLLSRTERARSMGLKDHQMELYRRMTEQGVDERFAARLFEKLNSGPIAGAEDDELQTLMRRLMQNGGTARPGRLEARLLAVVGPTGAGKTTTLAKLAARFACVEKKKVALISVDMHRIGAVDQLRVYGDIMRLPVEVAGNARDLRAAVRKHSDKDMILIDTTGKNHRDLAHARELREMFQAVPTVETHLVLSAVTQERVFEETYKQFAELRLDHLLFTKLDEAVCFGPLFNFALRARLPLSYFANGQRVPEDLEKADGDKVIRLIFS
jgi:flagellar biosynthesis protein FlhF